jgi:hypothetical protein
MLELALMSIWAYVNGVSCSSDRMSPPGLAYLRKPTIWYHIKKEKRENLPDLLMLK